MPAYARYAAANHTRYSHDDDGSDLPLCLSVDDRVGAPLGRRRGRLYRRGVIVAVLLSGAVWAYMDHRSLLSTGSQLAAAVTELASAAMEPRPSPSVPAANDMPPAAPEPLPEREAVEPHVPSARTTTAAGQPPQEAYGPPAPIETAALPSPATSYVAAPVSKATEPPTDPYRKRATTAGLHPDISRVLLEKLSDTDYRNARVAIRTALAEAADDAVYIWPRQAKPGLAVFQVHFVEGAAAGCRRYVVTIAKDGWRTTALPLETCTGVRTAVPNE